MNRIRKFEPLWGVWKCEEVLGEGSFGRVYKAVRRDGGRVYCSAVKHISVPANEQQLQEARRSGLYPSDAELSRYFGAIVRDVQKEIDFMYTLRGKPNIVSYEDHMVIPKPDGIGCDIFIRMEILKDLNSISTDSLYPADVVKIGTDICTALEECRRSDIIHRDIKPSNIFISPSGDYKLGDFGIAKVLGGATTGVSKKGTYAYMSPEVYKCEPVNFTTDIYSLGVVLYRLLNNNRLPFIPMTGTVLPKHSEEALMKMVSGAPMPPPKNASPQLAAVILKACAYDKRKRFQTATEFKNALTDALYGKYSGAHSMKAERRSDFSDGKAAKKSAADKPKKAAAAAAGSAGAVSANAAAALARKKSYKFKLIFLAEAVLLYYLSLIIDVVNSDGPSAILLLLGIFAGSQYLLCKVVLEGSSKFKAPNIITLISALFSSLILLLSVTFPESDFLYSISFVWIVSIILGLITLVFTPSMLKTTIKKSHSIILSAEIYAAILLMVFGIFDVFGSIFSPYLLISAALAAFILIVLQYDSFDQNKFTSKSFERLIFVQIAAVFIAGTFIPLLLDNLLIRLWIGLASIAVLGVQALLYVIFATKKGRNRTLLLSRICCVILAAAMVFFPISDSGVNDVVFICSNDNVTDISSNDVSTDYNANSLTLDSSIYEDSLSIIKDARDGELDDIIIEKIHGESTNKNLRTQHEELFNDMYNNLSKKTAGDYYTVHAGYYTWFCEYYARWYDYLAHSTDTLHEGYLKKASDYRIYAEWCYLTLVNADSVSDLRSIIRYLEERNVVDADTLSSIDEKSEISAVLDLSEISTSEDISSESFFDTSYEGSDFEEYLDSSFLGSYDVDQYISDTDAAATLYDLFTWDAEESSDFNSYFSDYLSDWLQNYEADENIDG